MEWHTVKARKSDVDAGCSIHTSRNFPLTSTVPCRQMPNFFFRPQNHFFVPTLALAQFMSVGFSIHVNMQSIAPAHVENFGSLLALNPSVIRCCSSWEEGCEKANSLQELTASTTIQTLLKTSVWEMPCTRHVSSGRPPAKHRRAALTRISNGYVSYLLLVTQFLCAN